jgi:hypothetical protein
MPIEIDLLNERPVMFESTAKIGLNRRGAKIKFKE